MPPDFESNSEAHRLIVSMFDDYSVAMHESRHTDARNCAHRATFAFRKTIESTDSEITEADRTNALLCGVFCAACRDLADCYALYKTSMTCSEIEDFWSVLIDCLDRIRFLENRVEGTAIHRLRDRAIALKDEFEKTMGPGLYLSPGMVIGREECSICNADFRGCAHHSGRIYGGRICRRIVKEVSKLEEVSIVSNPADPRCRIWPWNMNKEKQSIKGIVLISTFVVEDLRDANERKADSRHDAHLPAAST